MRYGRPAPCAETSAARTEAASMRARKVRIMSVGRRRFPVHAARGDGERDAAEEHEGRDRDERALVTPEDHEQAREQRAERVAEALEQPVDAVDRVVPVDADLLLAMLRDQRALRGDRERLPESEEEDDAEEHEEAVGKEEQHARQARDD